MNPEVTHLLDQLNHVLRDQIDQLREIILSAQPGIEENIKWNGPNYTYQSADRITLKINPPGSLTLVLHTGSKVNALEKPLINSSHSFLTWKSNDRAIIDLKNKVQFDLAKPYLRGIIQEWILASS